MIARRVRVPHRVPGRRVRASATSDFVDKVRAAETGKRSGHKQRSTEAVARYYFKLLAIKDEYEVARLYADGDFAQARRGAVRGRLQAQPSTSRRRLSNKPDTVTGEAKKSVYGPWMMSAFRVLAKMKRLARDARSTSSARRAERRMERQLITDYEALIDELLPRLARS